MHAYAAFASCDAEVHPRQSGIARPRRRRPSWRTNGAELWFASFADGTASGRLKVTATAAIARLELP